MKVFQLHEPIRAPKKSKTTPKLSQNLLSELKETKIKAVALYEQTPKQFEPTKQPIFSLKAKKLTHKLDKIKSKY